MLYQQFYAVNPSTGAAIAGCQVGVYDYSNALTSLFDQNGASIANPMTADSTGKVGFAAADGVYSYRFMVGGTVVAAILAVQIVDALALKASVAAETTRAETAEYDLGLDILAEATRARAAEGSLAVLAVSGDLTPSEIGSIAVEYGAASNNLANVDPQTGRNSLGLYEFASRAAASGLNVPAGVTNIYCNGIVSTGDCTRHHCSLIPDPGGALPVWQFRTNGGALCWEVCERFMSTDLFGVVADVVTISSIQTLVSSLATNQVNAPGANFLTKAKVGQMFAASGAGPSGANFYSVITSIQSNNICTLRDVPSTAVTNANGGWGTDNTAAMQAAATWATRGDVAGVNTGLQTELVHTAGLIGINGAISLTSAFAVTGFHWTVFGGRGSQSGSGIVQFADNAPIWTIGNVPAWGNRWTGGAATYATDPSSSLSSRCYINPVNTANGNDFHDNEIDDLTPSNMHYVVNSPAGLYWGNKHSKWFASKLTGGWFNVASGIGGQPNNLAEHLYLLAYVTAGPIFNCQAQQFDIVSCEINQANLGPKLISDPGGCDYTFNHLRLEGATYAGGANNPYNLLLDITNGTLTGERLEIASLIIPDGQKVYAINQGANPIANADVRTATISIASGGGQAFYSNALTRCVIGWATFPNNVFLTDVSSTSAADHTVLEAALDTTKRRYNTGSVTLTSADYNTQVWSAAISSNLTATLPSGYDNNLFSGQPFVCRKLNKTGSGSLTVGGVTIPAASAGEVELRYNRSLPGGSAFSWSVERVALW